MPQAFETSHFSVTGNLDDGSITADCSDGWIFDGGYNDSCVVITALSNETITKLVVHRSFYNNTLLVEVNENSISYTQSGNDFTYENINASEVRLRGNPDYSGNDFYCQVSSIDVYYEIDKPAPTTYTITWKDDYDNVIDTTTVAHGVVPTHDAPTKEQDSFYTYEFVRWDPEPVEATGDAEYRYVFISRDRPQYDCILKEITDYNVELEQLGIEENMSSWGRSITLDDAIELAQYRSKNNNNADCAVFYNVDDQNTLYYAKNDGTTGSREDFTKSDLNDFLPGNKVYYVSCGQTKEVIWSADNASYIDWCDDTEINGYWRVNAGNNDVTFVLMSALEIKKAAGEYEWKDLFKTSCYIFDCNAQKNTTDFIDGSCTVTIEDDIVTISGTFICDDANTYLLTITNASLIPPGYTITWKNEDGTEIEQTRVDPDAVPTHDAPTKDEDDYYTYTFAGWTPTPVAATADADYTAQFTKAAKNIKVIVSNTDETTFEVENVTGENTVAELKALISDQIEIPVMSQNS